MQSDWIRQNCAVQMERVRENYNWQVQNLRDIRHYGSNQVGAVRDQYFDQVRNSSKEWQYGLWSFQTGGTKLERFFPKNQHTQRKLLNFENWIIGGFRSFQKTECDVDSLEKTFLILYHPFENSTTRIAIVVMLVPNL